MAIGQYESVNGVARKVTKSYDSVAGIARNVIKKYDGVDGVARLFFAPDDGFDGTFKVEKITATTYEGETSYSSERFIRLLIFPKTNGTVNVTYGGLTKTITDTSGAAEPNGQGVFFGTFNGVTDSVETPDSGILTVSGDCRGAGCGTYKDSKGISNYCSCITAVGNISGFQTIPSSAFRGCSKIKQVDIPDGVTSISDRVFYGCTSLKNITLPKGVTKIGNHAFYNCASLESIVIPDGVSEIYYNTFENCANLTSVTIPKGVTNIETYAFQNCTSLTSVTIPEGVTRIEDYVFFGCKSLTTITIPSSVTKIGQVAGVSCDSTFRGCINLTNFVVASGNKNYSSSGDSLFNKDKTYLYCCPSAHGDHTIPASVTIIAALAFGNCEGLTSVTFSVPSGWYVSEYTGATSGTDVDVTDVANNVTLLTDTYFNYYWYRS